MMECSKRIGAFLLAMLVWLSTTAFTLNMHYCGSKMVSYSALTKAKPCCAASKSFQFSNKIDASSFKMMACCHDKKVEKESENELTYSIIKTEVQLQKILLRLPQLIQIDHNILLNEISNSCFKDLEYHVVDYYPDKNILFQTFLI